MRICCIRDWVITDMDGEGMQPATKVKFDEVSFERIKRIIRNMSVGKRGCADDPLFALEIPDEVGIQLTNKCNLRCSHCFQWNDSGFHNSMDKSAQQDEIAFDIVEKIVRETDEAKSNLYLWGGEPLSYGELDRFSRLLENNHRWTVLCTNGIDVEKNIDALLRMSSHLAMLISVEGFERENDSIRGKGTYQRVMNNITLLLELKKKGVYKGEVSVNCVINESMIGRLFDLAEMFESKGVNSLYFCFPWYIPEQTSSRMDKYFRNNFNWLRRLDERTQASWHSYKHNIEGSYSRELISDFNRIISRKWNIRLRFQPALEMNEIEGFLAGDEKTAQNRSKCIGIRNRMNVLPDGKVTVCKLFPEFTIGDLRTNSVREIWHSADFDKVRSIINCGLMPVCSKCILLYLHGV